MSLLKWINYFLFIEKCLGIYRDYHSHNKIKKCFIILQIFVLFILHGFILINEEEFLLGGTALDQIKLMHAGFSAASFVNSLSSVVAGIGYSRAFMSFVGTTSHVFECFRDDKYSYIHSLKKIYWFSVTSTVLCVVFSLHRSSQILINYLGMGGDNLMFVVVFGFMSQTLMRYIIVLEKIIFFFVIMIVVQLVKCLKSTISAAQKRVERCNISSLEQCDITREQIQGWVKLYRDLANCCEKVTLCFGRQFVFSCLMSTSYYILLTNHLCNKNMPNKGDRRTVVIALTFISIMMLPIVAGQMAHNQGIKFHRVLARLYNTMVVIDSREAEAKGIKDLIRLTKKNPIEIKLLSKVPTGMYMLPVVLMFAVNYIIIIMQFNNVI